MGRKEANEKDLLKFQIKTRVNEKGYRKLEKLLSHSRCRNMSELVRKILCKKQVTVITYDETLDWYMEQLILIQREINAVGVNINQVTQFFHGTSEEKQKTYQALKIAHQYREVGMKVERLYKLIEVLAEKWLQK